jgi:hypothetical protein
MDLTIKELELILDSLERWETLLTETENILQNAEVFGLPDELKPKLEALKRKSEEDIQNKKEQILFLRIKLMKIKKEIPVNEANSILNNNGLSNK